MNQFAGKLELEAGITVLQNECGNHSIFRLDISC